MPKLVKLGHCTWIKMMPHSFISTDMLKVMASFFACDPCNFHRFLKFRYLLCISTFTNFTFFLILRVVFPYFVSWWERSIIPMLIISSFINFILYYQQKGFFYHQHLSKSKFLFLDNEKFELLFFWNFITKCSFFVN